MGELDGVHGSFLRACQVCERVSCNSTEEQLRETDRPDDVRNVRHRRSRGGAKVEDLLSRCNVDVIETSEDTGSKLASERIPYAILDLLLRLGSVCRCRLDADPLLAVDGLSRDNVARNEEVLLALCYKDAGVSVRLDDDLGASSA